MIVRTIVCRFELLGVDFDVNEPDCGWIWPVPTYIITTKRITYSGEVEMNGLTGFFGAWHGQLP
jgi:hypothetical protein